MHVGLSRGEQKAHLSDAAGDGSVGYGCMQALVDEMLAQLRALASSGLECGVPPPALETDTSAEEDEDEDAGPAALS